MELMLLFEASKSLEDRADFTIVDSDLPSTDDDLEDRDVQPAALETELREGFENEIAEELEFGEGGLASFN